MKNGGKKRENLPMMKTHLTSTSVSCLCFEVPPQWHECGSDPPADSHRQVVPPQTPQDNAAGAAPGELQEVTHTDAPTGPPHSLLLLDFPNALLDLWAVDHKKKK